MTCRFPVAGDRLRMFLRAYELLWYPVAGGWLPAAGTGRRRLKDRLALSLPPYRRDPGAIWIHALSVGEVLSALPLVEALKRTYRKTDLVLSVTTEQGMSIASRMLSASVDRILTMPLDFPRAARRLIDHIRPSLFVLVETDIWPGMIGCLAQNRVPCLLVNGRVSPKTFRAYRRFSPLVKTLFSGFCLCLMQTELDRKRLLAVGVSPGRVKTVGNIKFDRRSDPMGKKERNRWRETLGLTEQDRVWVAGSTHPGEDAALLNAFRRLSRVDSRLRLIIAPRRIETADGILNRARQLGLAANLRTRVGQGSGDWKVLALDTLGELGRIYGLADIAFVGGSLVPMGGHNLLEPAAFGRPVIFGPHTHNFELMARQLEAAGGGIRVADEDALYGALGDLMGDDRKREACGRAALAFVSQNRGAVKQVLACIETIGRRQHFSSMPPGQAAGD